MAKIQTALISVSDKRGIGEFAHQLHRLGIRLISTGGTARIIREQGVPVSDVSDITGFPEILDGRVKSLHPAIHAGILARRDNPADLDTLKEHQIAPIDLVVVNLYPFRERTARGISLPQALEEIDIGGPTLLRAAAKNFLHVGVICNPDDYLPVIQELDRHDSELSLETRLELARKTFEHTAVYDSQIAQYLTNTRYDGAHFKTPTVDEELPAYLVKVLSRTKSLRYGENPHQKAALYVDLLDREKGWADVEQLHGKELSYNNYLDMEAAWAMVSEFMESACVIVKHNNPCGAAIGENCVHAYNRALENDPDSAFGSVIAYNRRLSGLCARELSKMFIEVVIAPEFEPDAIEILSRKKNLRLIRKRYLADTPPPLHIRDIEGAFLLQTADNLDITEKDLKLVSIREPRREELEDLVFAWKCVKHVRSNAIVLAKNKQLLGVGAGQMSRVDSVRLAVSKARLPLSGAVMASDAFLPFRDTLDVGADAGITALIQPGGSIRDEEVISAANERKISMLFTGYRHFRH